MSVRTDTAQEQVDATSFLNHLLVVSALGGQVLGVSVQDVDVLLGAVNMVEQVAGHERVIAFWMLLGQAYVLVHVECQHVLK